MIPFMTEEIYQNLVRSVDDAAPESVHLCDYPVANDAYIDNSLEEAMEEILKIVVMGRAARNDAAIKNRQPLGVMYVNAPKELDELYKEIIEDELNIKSVEFVSDMSKFSTYTFKPQLKTVGPKYGKLLGEIRTALSEIDGNAAKKELDETGSLKLALSSEVVLGVEDLLIDTGKVEGYTSISDGGYTVAIDTNLTEELIREGFVREIISKIQTMRKDAGFDVMDHIKVSVSGNAKLADIVNACADEIKHDVLADEISVQANTSADAFTKEWNINGEDAVFSVEKL
jgi:isoleucyl-tRNA synthetase